MRFPSDLPIVDHHCHLSPQGEGLGAVRRFREAGGTHLFLATQNYSGGPPLSLGDYLRQFETTESIARAAERELGVVVYPVVAPYPVDLVRASERLGVEPALELHQAALDLAGRWVRERRAVALGEVGRPHFPIDAEVAAASDAAFRHALGVARDSGCPAIVHCEDLDGPGYRALAELGRACGLPARRLVKHYARDTLSREARQGVVRSVLARRELVEAQLGEPAPWFWETDFLDDPKRPGAVLDLATVPRRARAILERSAAGAEALSVPFVESVREVYGWAPEVPSGARP